MKKLVKLVAGVLSLGALLVSCASTGGSSKAAKETVPGVPHPRTYVVDLADSTEGKNVELAYNQYGPNYQSTPNLDFTKFIKTNKPQAGDTIIVNYKFTVDKDLPVILIGLVDGSAKANYWLNLLDPSTVVLAEDIKAGEVVEGSFECVLAQSVLGAFQAYIQYDSDDSVKMGYPLVGSSAKLSFQDVEGVDTTDTSNEEGTAPAAPKGPQTHNVELHKVAAFFQLESNHPWIDGVQDMSQTVSYQGIAHFGNLYPEDLPQAGDTIHVTWHAKSDVDIDRMHIRLVENSGAVKDWWAEIGENGGEGYTLIEGVKAGETFDAVIDLNVAISALEDISFTIWAELDECSQPATIIFSRD